MFATLIVLSSNFQLLGPFYCRNSFESYLCRFDLNFLKPNLLPDCLGGENPTSKVDV